MAWNTKDIPDQHGRVAVITGANGGLGLETARALAAKGAHIVMAVRNEAKAAAAVEDIRATVPGAALELVALDLGSQESVRSAAAHVLDTHEQLDLLVNNAGVMAVAEGRTADGFETQFGVNHLGHWTLTALLLPALLRTPGSRVVTVTSAAHHLGRAIDPANPNLAGRYGPWRAYSQAKLANFHFGLGLQRRLAEADANTVSLIAHPGLSNTGLQAASVEGSGGGLTQRISHAVIRRTGMSAANGALSQLRAATDPAAKGGQFYGPAYLYSGPPVRKTILRRLDMATAITTLWEVSERETGTTIDMKRAVAA